MSALRSAKGGRGMAAGAAAAWARLVLPRWLRRPARLAARLASGEIAYPRFAATLGTAGFLALTGLYGAILGGHMPSVVQGVAAHGGFAVDDVRMAGNKETSDIDVLEKLELTGWTSLVGFDADAARERIAGLPWVESASVRKIYPDVLEVTIEERKPFAIWQHGRELSLIDAEGRIIAPFRQERFATLPLVIGRGANERAAEFLSRLDRVPGLAARTKALIRVADRRWDLRLENGIAIRLPEFGEDAAVDEIARLDREQGILSRDIAAVDMRLEDRLVVQLTPDAVVRREAALKEQEKLRGKPGKRI